MMDDQEQLSTLIGGVYDATLDPSLWTDVLCKASEFVGGPAASLFSKDTSSKTGSAVYTFGIEPRFEQSYFEHYIKLDPTTTGQFFSEIGEPVATADLISNDEFLQSRFYQEWVRPQRLIDFLGSVIDKSMTSMAMFGVFRHERDGVTDDAARMRMRLIAPHIRRSVLVARLIDLKQAEAATFADALDGLNSGLILVDANGQIVHANAAGHGILMADDFLRSNRGRLVARNPQIDQSLREIVLAASGGDGAVGVKGIALPFVAHDGERYVAHVLPLTSGARRGVGIAYTAAVALFVRKAAMEAPSPPEVIAQTYKLTPTELRVLLAIVEVGGVPEVATALGVADTTIRTHLGRVFEKTGANRQADLVKLVSGFSNPVAA